MLIRIWIVSGILLGLACFAIAQQKPDFSGEWTLNRQASTLSPGAAAVQSGVVRIEHRDPTFRYKASFVTASGPLQYEYELHSDGTLTRGKFQSCVRRSRTARRLASIPAG